MSGADIVNKLDELLKDDKNFDTRAGLRFMTELVRDAFDYIEAQKKSDQDKTSTQNSILTRLSHVENGLNDFMKLRKAEQEKAEVERRTWRWAIFTPITGYVVIEILKWILR